MADVFISYSRRDTEFVRALGEALEAAGRVAWVDWKDIPLTVEWQQEIEDSIDAADTFLFVISPDSIASTNCAGEIKRAVAQHKRLIPILHRAVADEAVPEALGRFQRIDFSDPLRFAERFRLLLQALDTDLPWVRAHTRLLMRAQEWLRRSQDASLLLRGKDLTEAELWASRGSEKEPRPTAQQSQYILASRRAAMRLQRRVVGAVSVALVVAVALAIFAFLERNAARRSQHESQARELTAVAAQSLQEDPERSLLLGLHAVNATQQYGEPVVPAVIEILQQSLMASHVRRTLNGHTELVLGVAYSPNGRLLASTSYAGEVVLWEVGTGRRLMDLNATGQRHASAVTFSHDGTRVAAGFSAGKVAVWRSADGQSEAEIDPGVGKVMSLAFNSDGQRLVVAGTEGVAIWGRDVGLHTFPKSLGMSEAALAVVSATGDHIAILTGQATVKLFGPTGQRELDVGKREIATMAFSPDGRSLALGERDGRATVWETKSARLLLTVGGTTGTVYSAAFNTDGSLLATGSRDGTVNGSVRVWDVQTGTLRMVMRGHASAVLGLAFSPDGTRIATAGGGDRTVRIWEAQGPTAWLRLPGWNPDQGQTSAPVAFSGDGRWLASVADCGRWRLWDLRAGRSGPSEVGGPCAAKYGDRISSLALNLDGSLLVASSANDNTRTWRPGQGNGPSGPWVTGAERVSLSAGESRLMTLYGHATVWDLRTRKRLVEVPGAAGAVMNRDGTRLATVTKEGDITVLDAGSGEKLLQWHEPQIAAAAPSLAFSGDGHRLAAVGHGAAVWDVRSGKRLRLWEGHQGGWFEVALSEDGSLMAATGRSRAVQMWDVSTGQTLLNLTDPSSLDALSGVAFRPGDDRLAISWRDGSVQLVSSRLDDLLVLVRQRITRQLTLEECMRYLRSTSCPALPPVDTANVD